MGSVIIGGVFLLILALLFIAICVISRNKAIWTSENGEIRIKSGGDETTYLVQFHGSTCPEAPPWHTGKTVTGKTAPEARANVNALIAQLEADEAASQ